MGRKAAATILLLAAVLGGVRAAEAGVAPSANDPPELVSPYRQYDLKLRAFYPAPRCLAGVLLQVRINGGPPLRLVLDSGAEVIVIGTRAARSVGLSAQSELDLVGWGGAPSKVGRAETVQIGPISFRNCRVAVVEGKVIEVADGVIPLSLFSAFRLRLDLPQKTLALIPDSLGEDRANAPSDDAGKHNLLLVATVLNGRQSGYVLLDTGAYCSAISREAARALGGFQIAQGVPLMAGTGAAIGQHVSTPVHFALAARDLVSHDVVAVDLSNLSRHSGVEVMGVIGFPELRNYILTVDYHHGQVGIESPQLALVREAQRRHDAKSPVAQAFH